MANFIGLLIDTTEPDASTGYARVEGDLDCTLIFPTSTGYGMITHIGIFDSEVGDTLLDTIELPEPVDVHEGVIPIVQNRRLLRGIDVTAHVVLKSADLMSF